MEILLTILVSILIIGLLVYVLCKLTAPYAREVIFNVIDIACYVNTYHYNESEQERILIGQEKYYKSLFGEKTKPKSRKRTDFVFSIFYTKFFEPLFNCVPIDITKQNNRTLAEGEERKIESFLDNYLSKQQQRYDKYASRCEKGNCQCENKNSEN